MTHILESDVGGSGRKHSRTVHRSSNDSLRTLDDEKRESTHPRTTRSNSGDEVVRVNAAGDPSENLKSEEGKGEERR